MSEKILDKVMPDREVKRLGKLASEAQWKNNLDAIRPLKTSIKSLLAVEHEQPGENMLSIENSYDVSTQRLIDTEGFKGLII